MPNCEVVGDGVSGRESDWVESRGDETRIMWLVTVVTVPPIPAPSVTPHWVS